MFQLALERLGMRKNPLGILWFVAALPPQRSHGLKKNIILWIIWVLLIFKMEVIFFDASCNPRQKQKPPSKY